MVPFGNKIPLNSLANIAALAALLRAFVEKNRVQGGNLGVPSTVLETNGE